MTPTMQYGALTAKIHARYGKRLRASDFRQLSSLHSIAEIADYLRQTAWSPATDMLQSNSLDRAELHAALRNCLRTEYAVLNHFVPQQDKTLLKFPVWLTELEAVSYTLRRLSSVSVTPPPPIPLVILQHGRLDYSALAASKNYNEVTEAAKKTIYYSPLQRLKPEAPGELPDYTLAEVLLHSTYFSFLYRQIHRNYSGETRSVLLRTLGEQVDLLNITHILRLKRFFPEDEEHLGLLFPFQHRLSPDIVKKLISAPNVDSVLNLLAGTPYANKLSGVTAETVDEAFGREFYCFNRIHLRLSLPSIYAAVAYLNLKELELADLTRVIECVHYGIPFERIGHGFLSDQ